MISTNFPCLISPFFGGDANKFSLKRTDSHGPDILFPRLLESLYRRVNWIALPIVLENLLKGMSSDPAGQLFVTYRIFSCTVLGIQYVRSAQTWIMYFCKKVCTGWYHHWLIHEQSCIKLCDIHLVFSKLFA